MKFFASFFLSFAVAAGAFANQSVSCLDRAQAHYLNLGQDTYTAWNNAVRDCRRLNGDDMADSCLDLAYNHYRQNWHQSDSTAWNNAIRDCAAPQSCSSFNPGESCGYENWNCNCTLGTSPTASCIRVAMAHYLERGQQLNTAWNNGVRDCRR